MSLYIDDGLDFDEEGANEFIQQSLIIAGALGVLWVHSGTGSDSNPGTEARPYATLAAAISAASADFVIMVKKGHAETLSSAVTVNKRLRIFGLGEGTSKPTFTVAAAIDGFNVTAAEVWISNFRFPIGTTADNSSRINVGAAGVRITDCDFICGSRDVSSITIEAAGTYLTIKDCTFTMSVAGADHAIIVESASVVGLWIEDCVFNGTSSLNWDVAAIYSNFAHRFLYKNIQLNEGAGINHANSALGILSGIVEGDGSVISV